MNALRCLVVERGRLPRLMPQVVGRLLLASTILLALVLPPRVSAQQPAGGDNDSIANRSDVQEDTAGQDVAARKGGGYKIPASLPDGRPIRTIGLYQSQWDELIPNHYFPVAIDRFNQALQRLTDRATDDQTSRLKGAVYWVEVMDDTLVSNRSVIDIESDRPAEVRRSLGRVNLAIEQPPVRGASASPLLPRLESEPDGNLVAVFRGDAKVRTGIEFKWRLRGRVVGIGHEFSMRLPPTPQTRIVLSAPNDISVEATDGVLRKMPGPPPDAIAFTPDRNWYQIDAGGLNLVRIRTQLAEPATEGASFIVRKTSIQYLADPGGLNWNCRMLVQPPDDRPLPPIMVGGTKITSAKVNSTDVAFSSKMIGGQQQRLEIEVPRGVIDSQAALVNVTLTGHKAWNGRGGWCDLPMPVWIGNGVVHASVTDDVELAVIDPLQVMSWKLPPQWRQLPERTSAEGSAVFGASGPPVALINNTPVVASEASAASQPTWSRVRFVQQPVVTRSNTALLLEVDGGSLSASARIALQTYPGRIEPLRLEIQRGWEVDSVTFVSSGRVIENPAINENNRTVDLWPEPEDLDGSELVMQVEGTRLLATGSAAVSIPSTWFARVGQVRGKLTAAILRPTDLNWSGEAAMKRLPTQPSDLNAAESDFFSSADDETLWFRPEAGRTPPVRLQNPTVAFSAATLLGIFRDGDEITETLVVDLESQGQSLKELTIQTGPALDRPRLTWSISGIVDSRTTSLPPSDVTLGEGESDGIYTINVADKNLRGRRLIARRRYAIGGPLMMQLPSVSGAASQRSEAHVGPGLLIKQKSRAVQLVPFENQSSSLADTDVAGRTGDLYDSELTADALGRTGRRHIARLRYDAVEQPSITLVRSDVNPELTIIWQEQVRVIASSRGTDMVEAIYKVSPAVPLQIAYDDELQLASIVRDGVPVDLISISQRPIVLQPNNKTETVRVRWNRSHFQSGWIRRCRMPRITASGTILQSEYQLVSSTDTFAPAALLRGQNDPSARISTVAMRPGQNAILVRRNIALAIGWMIALLLFAASWFVAERSPLAITLAVVMLTAVLFLWWPWRLAIIGWFIVPLLAAMMLATSRAWNGEKGHGQDGASGDRPSDEAPTGSKSKLAEISADLSFDTMARFMLVLLVVWISSMAALAQQAPGDRLQRATRTAPVNVLVPMTKEGKVAGEMVYIPGSLRSQLFPATTNVRPQTARIQSANYRVRLDPSVSDDQSESGVSVDAEYLIHVEEDPRNETRVLLPLSATSVRRIERLGDISGMVQTAPDANTGQVIVALPKGNAFQLRVTLRPAISRSEQWTKLFLPIPSVASSRLTVESEQNIDALRVGGASGALLRETDLRRWVEQLGPVDSLELDYRVDSASPGGTKPLKRRYWLNANSRQVTIDCEVEPPNEVALGETFQFVVRDQRLPSVTSSAWRLDRSESITSSRHLITVTSTRDSPGPVRLLWTEPLAINGDEAEEPTSIKIPEVIAAALGENAPAWIAMHCDPSLRFLPPSGDDIEPLTVDYFLAAWSGYRGAIDRAIVALGEFPVPILETITTAPPAIEQRHDLRVTRDRLELHYSATVTLGETLPQRPTLRLPRSLQLVRLTVDGQPLDAQPVRSGKFNEILLGRFSEVDSFQVEAIATASWNPQDSRRFTPPSMELLPAAPTSATYTISRDRTIHLKVVEPPEVEPNDPLPTEESELLVQGWIPVSIWSAPSLADSSSRVSPGGEYEVRVRNSRFDTSQWITLNRQDGQWTMESKVRFQSDRIPDYVDIEVPTSWCESLEVTPAESTYSQRPGTDASRQILRIRCDESLRDGDPLSIRGRLQNLETGRVNVPAVNVLGLGQRRVYINLPSQFSGEPIQWRTSAVEAAEVPSMWKTEAASTARSTYVVANPSWSIELAPLPEDDSGAVAFNADAQVFLQPDGALVVCHWDLFPGSLETVQLRMPPGATCVGAWSAGRAVVAERLTSDEQPETDYLTVPLNLSRLSQPVEVLLRIPAATARRADYLPELMGVSVTRNWLVNYVPQGAASNVSRTTKEQKEDRALALARSVVDAVAAVSRVTQRPRAEVAAWLELWVTRYRMISDSVERPFQLDEFAPAVATETIANEPGSLPKFVKRLSLPRQIQWKDLDSELAYHVNRLMPSDSATVRDVESNAVSAIEDDAAAALVPSADTGPFLFQIANFEGFTAQRITQLSATNRPQPMQSASASHLGLRTLIVNLLTLFLVGGLVLCLRPIRHYLVPVVVHPAVWLALMGIFGFAVAPVTVAGAIVLVAVSLPAFPSRS